MEQRQIKELMAAMGRHGIKKLAFEKEGCKLELESVAYEAPPAPQAVHVPMPAFHHLPPSPVAAMPPAAPMQEAAPAKEHVDNSLYVTSPIVGTFYLAPGPDEKPFVEVGDRIDVSTVVCIVEAMKVMNEVKAGVRGRVVEILIDDAHPVEFSTKLIRVEPE